MKLRVLIFIFILHLAPWSKANSADGIDDFLQGFVSQFSKSEIDFFYASQPSHGPVYIYWMTGNSILIVDLPTKRLDDYAWYESKARIDLNSDVVPTADDIGGKVLAPQPAGGQDHRARPQKDRQPRDQRQHQQRRPCRPPKAGRATSSGG